MKIAAALLLVIGLRIAFWLAVIAALSGHAFLRVLAIVALIIALEGCAAPPPIVSIDGPTCRRGVTRTFWVPCDPARLLRT